MTTNRVRQALVAAAMRGYEGVTVAGLAIVRFDGEPSVFLSQRSYDETDDEDVRETWEFPGGHLNPGEEPFAAAAREFEEEIGFPLPPGEVIDGWRSEDGHYQCFLYEPVEFPAITDFKPTSEVQDVGWFTQSDVEQSRRLRPEVAKTDWSLVFGGVSGNEESSMDEAAQYASIPVMPIPVHGVVAPEEVEAGDGRGFAAGSITQRPLRLPFRDTFSDEGGHKGAFVVGSVDRLMRADGMVHWEGLLMPSPHTEAVVAKMEFFGGKYGVSVDGDQGSIDARTKRNEKGQIAGPLWFAQVRASGLTACDIPAFHEAHVAFGLHPSMPGADEADAVLAASAYETGDLIGGRVTFDRGPGWVTNPKETKNIHDYWTKKGEEGYAKIGWGTPGDFTRAKSLIGAKIAQHSPEKMKYLNQIIAQWHHDALGYWPGDLGKPGNAPDTAENRQRAARHAAAASTHGFSAVLSESAFSSLSSGGSIEVSEALFTEAYAEGRIVEVGEREDGAVLYDLAERAKAASHGIVEIGEYTEGADEGSVWEAVLTSSAGVRAIPPVDYFSRHPDTGALVIEEPDEFGLQRTYGYAAEWGVCHIGIKGRCVEPPRTGSDEYKDFHLGRTKVTTQDGSAYINTGVLTYLVDHRNADMILTETAEQQHYDNVANAWAAVRVGEDDRGVWFSGVVLPKIDAEDCVLIEATGQVSGEWKYGSMRAAQAVNVPGYPVLRSSAAFDEDGNVTALVAVTTGKDASLVASMNGVETSECYENSPKARMLALAKIDAESRMEALRASVDWAGGN